jgi:signal transduction histidine kinase
MSRWTSTTTRPLPTGRRLGFFLVTLAAFAIDALTVVPDQHERDGQHFPVWGGWETSIGVFVPLLAGAYAALLLRRRWPLVALAGISVLSLSFTFAPLPALPMAGVLVSLYTAAALVDRRWLSWLTLGLTICVQVTGLVLYEGVDGNDIWLGMLLLSGISYSMWVFGRRDRSATLAAMDLPDQLAEHGELAAAHERRRIARELHDIVAHSVSAMMMQAAGAKAVTVGLHQDHDGDPRLATVERALATIENTGSQSMRELHRLLGVLRGDGAEVDTETESSSQPGMAEIAALVELTRHTGLVVEVHVAGPPVRLDPSVGLAAYRVVQETLTNAMKHGGRGAVVDIFQNWQPDSLQLQVRCRGGHEGAPAAGLGSGSGLIGLQERVALIGGTFEAGRVGDEFVATAVLPLTPAGASAPALPSRPATAGSPPPSSALHAGHGSRLAGPRALDTGDVTGAVPRLGPPLARSGPLRGDATTRSGMENGS